MKSNKLNTYWVWVTMFLNNNKINTIYELKYLMIYLDNMVYTVDNSPQNTEEGGTWVRSKSGWHRETSLKYKRNWQYN